MLLCTVNMYPKSCFSKCFKLLSAHGDNDMYSKGISYVRVIWVQNTSLTNDSVSDDRDAHSHVHYQYGPSAVTSEAGEKDSKRPTYGGASD